jgi:FkbM family methyltransferase
MHKQMPAVGKLRSAILRRYYCGIDHPFKLRLWAWLRRRQRYRRLTVRYGHVGWLTVDERCFIQRHVFVSGSYEPEVAETLLARASGHEVVWDVGANIGSFAIAARLNARVEHVVCIEPDPKNREALETNLSLNRGASYRVCGVALSDHSELRSLWQGPTINRGMSTLTGPAVSESATCLVECTTLDELVFGENLPAPTLMKIDIEGWEYRALLGAQRLLRQVPPKAIVFESRCSSDGEMYDPRIGKLLGDCGYQIRKIRRPTVSVDAQENFLASRRVN